MEALISAWLQQLTAGVPDPALTAQLAARLADSSRMGNAAAASRLLAALQMQDLPPEYEDALNSLEEIEGLWDLDRMGEEEFRDLTRSVPAFDLSFLGASTPPVWASELVAAAIAQGKRYVQDSLDSLYILLTPPRPFGTTAGSTLRSLSGDLPEISLQVEQGLGWDVEVTTKAESDAKADALATCDVRVSARHPDGVPANVAVTIRYSGASGDEWESAVTDAEGVAVFTGIPQAALDRLVIRLQAVNE